MAKDRQVVLKRINSLILGLEQEGFSAEEIMAICGSAKTTIQSMLEAKTLTCAMMHVLKNQ